ncbi:MAG: DUF4198 domain-containing protein [bacterium]
MKILQRVFFGLFAALIVSNSLQAHEFWMEPENPSVSVGDTLKIKLRVGQHLKGNQQPYIESWFEEFQIRDAEGMRPVKGMQGDMPAFAMKVRAPGLQVVNYVSSTDDLRYRSREQFERFIEYEGLTGVLERHQERGLPELGFREDYVRCAKALAVGGTAEGQDLLVGMPLELLAEENPYLTKSTSLPVRLFWQGEPLPDIQIRIFHRGGETEETTVRTDTEGRAQIPLTASGFFLLNAVHMLEVEQKNGAVWKSYWASLSFTYQ